MKLKEQLELLKGKQVKLGARMGFIYCEICDDNIEKVLSLIEEKEYQRILRIKNITSKSLKNFDNHWKNKKGKRIELLKKQQQNKLDLECKKEIKNAKMILKEKGILLNKKHEEKIKRETLKKWEKTFEKQLKELIEKTNIEKKESLEFLNNRYDNYSKYVKEFKPFLEREVLEVYNSIVDEETIIVRFTGNECGKYWDREEYILDMKKENKK